MLLFKEMNRRRLSKPARRTQVSLARRSFFRPLRLEALEDRRVLSVNFSQVGAALDTQLLGMQTQLTTTLNNYQTGPGGSVA